MSNIIKEEISKPYMIEKMKRTTFLRLKNEEILNLLKKIYPQLKIQTISTSWRTNPKEDLIAEGEIGYIIVKLIK